MIEIISSMLSYYSEIKIVIDKNQIFGKSPNIWKLNSMPQNNMSFKEEITGEFIKYNKVN